MKDKPQDKPLQKSCICFFDIDDTLTCQGSLQLVNHCKQKQCDMAIVTARPGPHFEVEGVTDQFHAKHKFYNPFSWVSTPLSVANTKVDQMMSVSEDYDKILFFDDNLTNIQQAQKQKKIEAYHIKQCSIDIPIN